MGIGEIRQAMDSRDKAYKFVAYSAVSFSLVAVLAAAITLPMVYNYVNDLHAQVRLEVRKCKVGITITFFCCYASSLGCHLIMRSIQLDSVLMFRGNLFSSHLRCFGINLSVDCQHNKLHVD